MREILFRGKRTDNGEWWYGLPLRTINKDGEDVLNIQCWERDEEGVTGIYDPVDPETIGQCIGLADKNDEKIFEGDIVEYKDENGEIVYDEKQAMFSVQFDTWCTDFDHIYSNELEIIGNIHDNPELLRGDNNAF